MFPWDHLAIGYIIYSLLVRAFGDRPTDEAGLAVAVGSQFPDLVDKPLAWTFAALPSGTSLAHSLLVAIPTVTLLTVVAVRYGRGRTATGFSVAYLLHLPADILYGPLISGDLTGLDYSLLLWPLVPQPTGSLGEGLFATTLYYLNQYYVYLQSPEAVVYVLLEVALLGGALGLWIADGRPGFSYLTAGRSRHPADPE
jgi:hypothetical protein